MAEIPMSDAKPMYVHRATVWFDELDMLGVLHNARYAIHVERAMTSWYHSIPDPDPSDAYIVVRHYDIEFIKPFTTERGELSVEVRLERLGTTSAVFAFRCLSRDSEGAEIEHARGSRTNVKVSPGELRPVRWSARFREVVGA
ncbi:MAG TPA: hotdog domain-containing protein [Actinocrinis sp.]|jgi:acyl-CoA thioester hydrolase|uniref:acyl-CoA thioesterase n=1 Tax=Actinocrinis sp. TaxID=1920516 RepID=UPI002DDD2C0A|nr:hotdog domain-containing protein [Actinocrinis sp.]HEV3170127.1 hotdog domain-containing protein [Actinocrinis sp.]